MIVYNVCNLRLYVMDVMYDCMYCIECIIERKCM